MQPTDPSRVIAHILRDDGKTPNNRLPLLHYRGVLDPDARTAEGIQELFERNGWTGAWVNGVYDYLHYHSTAHEVLGCFRGLARVQFGGDHGIEAEFQAGDVVVIPAGVGHRKLGGTADFRVVGAYPEGQENDLCESRPGERPAADQRIASVPLPKTDPVYGPEGPLLSHWRR